jgi:hypothetical protein
MLSKCIWYLTHIRVFRVWKIISHLCFHACSVIRVGEGLLCYFLGRDTMWNGRVLPTFHRQRVNYANKQLTVNSILSGYTSQIQKNGTHKNFFNFYYAASLWRNAIVLKQ